MSKMRIALHLGILIWFLQCLDRVVAIPTNLAQGRGPYDNLHWLNGVTTTSGRYIGYRVTKYPSVIEYLGVHYAMPPVGNLRFATPVPYVTNETFEASSQPPDCPYVAQPWGSVPGEHWSHAPRIMAQESADGYNAMAEDCLKLNIWAPHVIAGKKPVMVFLYGGGFERGSVNNPAYNGAKMAAAQDIVVVTFNYRVNILGFANAPGADTNVALRDMRLAIEWVYKNIASFGGDPESITLFGQSQGAYLISYYAYAFPDDPIAHAFIQQSGTAFLSHAQSLTVKAQTWHNASASIGCTNDTEALVLQCMQSQDLSTILDAWTTVSPTAAQIVPFGPAIDDRLVFSNYTEKTLSREFAQKPFLIGSNANEAGFYALRFAGTDKLTLNKTELDKISYDSFVCPAALDAATKAATNATIYRYEYLGDYPNLSLFPGSGAYHTSETSMVFGTMEDVSGDPNTKLEEQVSSYIQSAWATFARNPEHGLEALSWPTYDPMAESLIQLGNRGETTASFTSPAVYDAMCEQL